MITLSSHSSIGSTFNFYTVTDYYDLYDSKSPIFFNLNTFWTAI